MTTMHPYLILAVAAVIASAFSYLLADLAIALIDRWYARRAMREREDLLRRINTRINGRPNGIASTRMDA
jgi:hypothetical protein